MKHFSKQEIINIVLDLPDKLDEKEISERAWLDRLKESIKFLKNNKILNREVTGDADYNFFQKYVNLTHHVVEKPRLTHYFEPVAAIMLMAFLAQYEHPFIKSYEKEGLVNKEESVQWFSNIERTVIRLMENVYANEVKEEQPTIEFLTINIISQFAKLAGREVQFKFMSNQVDEHIESVVVKLKALSNEDKVALYNVKVKKLLDKIESEIEKVVSKYDSTEKRLFDIDLEILQTDKPLEDTIKLHMED